MGDRTTAPEVKTFVSALVQADRLGLPVADVLREQAKEMRLVRRQRAEEKAQKVPVKILFPLLLLHLPGPLHRHHRPRRHPHHGDVRRILTRASPTPRSQSTSKRAGMREAPPAYRPSSLSSVRAGT